MMTTDTLIIESDELLGSEAAAEVAPNSASVKSTADEGSVLPLADPGVSHLRPRSKQGSDIAFPRLTSSRPIEFESLTLSQLSRDLIELTKPRIVVMILVTTLATAFVGAGQAVGLQDLFWLLLGTSLIAASAGSANQVWERVIDKQMARTASRPVATGRVQPAHAVVYTAAIGISGLAILFRNFQFVPAIVGLATWLLYVLIYTPMKTRTSWNTTVGAIAGALPMLIGYTATGGSLIDVTGWLLVGILVAWQYPHFMAIAWMYRQQYRDAGFRMSTTVDPTGGSAGIQSIGGSILLIVCAVSLCWMRSTITGAVVASCAVLLFSWPMLRVSIQFNKSPNDQIARLLLRKSLIVLPMVLAVVTIALLW